MADDVLSVIIPIKDEAATIEKLVALVEEVEVPAMSKQVILVDDGSSDGTYEILQKFQGREGYVLLHHAQNRGKGAAIRTGLEHATGSIVLIQDADHEYDPSEYPVLVEPIQRGETRVVYGSRFQGSIVGMQLANRAANKILSLMASALGPSHITDEATCFKVFDATLLKAMPLRCRRFEFCPEVTGLLQGMGEAIVEVPIKYTGRGRDAGKKVRAKDGVIAVAWLLHSRFGRRAERRDLTKLFP
ncbi:MAG: hypothetical protein QOG82_1242 [Actinomycetota bacterium]|jgi:hypothetical protein|nr:hypothetical protein [Actinomycetota bacterium]